MFNTRELGLFTVGLLLAAGIPARAGILLTTGDVYGTHEARTAESAILTYVAVGASDVTIAGFGSKGMISANGNVEFAIFDGGNSNDTLFVSTSQAVRFDGTDRWYDSPTFTFTLLANQSYYLGLISDKAFTYDWNLNVPAVASNGLTAVFNMNGNAISFTNPVFFQQGGVQQAIEIFDGQTGVPEPATFLLTGGVLIGFAGIRRRFAR